MATLSGKVSGGASGAVTAVRAASIWPDGHLIYDTTQEVLYVGDGSTTGGVALLGAETDPSALKSANNLSDLASVSTAQTNLSLGTAAVEDVGTTANNIVQLNGSGQLPALDASLLTSVPTTLTATRTAVNSAASPYTALAADQILGVDTSGLVNIVLPVATTGKIYIIADESGNAGTNSINITCNGVEMIDGSSFLSIATNYAVATLYGIAGTGWKIF